MPKLDRKAFADEIIRHRERLRLTQAELAELLEVSPRVLWKWEKAGGDTLAVTKEGVVARLRAAKPKSKD